MKAVNSPDFFPTAEGFYDYKNSKYIYQYKDHLGNVRLSYERSAEDGSVAEVSRNNYYPFGLNHINITAKTGHTVYNPSVSYENWKYNGKELEETGMYDYGARFYMPDIGRFGMYDPLAEKTFEPYAYVYNNPIKFIDPTGMDGEDVSSGGGETGAGGDNPYEGVEVIGGIKIPAGTAAINIQYSASYQSITANGGREPNKKEPDNPNLHKTLTDILNKSLGGFEKTINFETSTLAFPFGSISGRDNDVAVPDFDFYTIKGTINVRGNKVSVVAYGQSSNTNLSKIYYTGSVSINGSSPYGLSSFNSEKAFNPQKGVNEFQPGGYSYIGRTDFVIPSGTMIFNVNIKAAYVGSTNNDTALVVPFFPFGKASYSHTFFSGSGSSGINQYPLKK